MPLTSLEGVNVLDNLTYMQPRIGNDTAYVGYYQTSLASGIDAEITASQHAGLFKYSFPETSDKFILVDLSHYLPTQDDNVGEQFYGNGRIDLSPHGEMYSGYGAWRGGFNRGMAFSKFSLGS